MSDASPLSPGAPQLTPEGWRTSPFDRFDGALDKVQVRIVCKIVCVVF